MLLSLGDVSAVWTRQERPNPFSPPVHVIMLERRGGPSSQLRFDCGSSASLVVTVLVCIVAVVVCVYSVKTYIRE